MAVLLSVFSSSSKIGAITSPNFRCFVPPGVVGVVTSGDNRAGSVPVRFRCGSLLAAATLPCFKDFGGRGSEFFLFLTRFDRSSMVSVVFTFNGFRPRLFREKLLESIESSLRGSIGVLESLGADGLFTEDCFFFNNGLSTDGKEVFLTLVLDVGGSGAFLTGVVLGFGEGVDEDDVAPTFPSL